MKRALLIVLVLMVVAFGVYAGGTAEKETESVVLRALIRPDEGGNVQKYADIFEAETGIRVEVDFVGWAEIHDKSISTLSAGGGGYDIIFVPSANVVEFTSVGDFEALNNMISSGEKADWLQPVLDLYTREGDLVAMPWYSGGAHMVYNKEILDKAGVDPEKIVTWNDFKDACKKIKAAELLKYVYTPTAKYPGNFYYAWGSMVASSGESFFDAAGKPVFDKGSAVLDSLKLVSEGTKEGLFDPAAIAMDDYEALIQFGSGDTAFMMNSTWSATQAYRNADLSKVTGKVGYMLIPGWKSEPRSGGFLYAGGLGILKSSRYKEEAKQFLTLLTSADAQKHHAIEGANLPTRVALFEDKEIDSSWAGYKALTAQLSYGSFLPQYSWFEEWRQATSGVVQKTIAGNITPEKAFDLILENARKAQ
ncbi:MAG: sugar ABC transporter substrate-binding protein [Spirochaetales bacterium]|nr:sugar ABC transporter substrate-binding protein [Spirochaetales bacterium]